MPRLLNPDRYPFKWLAQEIVDREMTVYSAAVKIEVTVGTIYNWLEGRYLKDAACKAQLKDDVATKIANMLDITPEEVRYQIKLYLKSTGQIAEFDEKETFKSVVAKFTEKINQTTFYDDNELITTHQRVLIASVLNVLNKI